MLDKLAEQNGHRAVHYVEDKTELPAFLLGLVESGDLVITMGAGDIWRQGKAFFEQLVERNVEVASCWHVRRKTNADAVSSSVG